MPNLVLPTRLLALLYFLQHAGYESYLVGGAVRDLYLTWLHHQSQLAFEPTLTPSYDYDLTTVATPEQILAVFPDGFYANDFGTVSLPENKFQQYLLDQSISIAELPVAPIPTPASPRIIDLLSATKVHDSLALPDPDQTVTTPSFSAQNYEITTYRSQEIYEQDFRHPSQLEWGKTILEDLQRRDFTINAMAIKIRHDFLAQLFTSPATTLPALTELTVDQAELIDPFGGLDDLRQGLIRAVGEPPARFAEDALRMLRCLRFSVQLDLQIEEQTWGALLQKADLIQHISWERIRDEFLKMLASPHPAEAIDLLDQSGLLTYILPELLQTKGVEQSGHHTTDVWVHSLAALAACPSADPIVRLATLLHDIGKPATQRRQDSQFTFYNHQIVGAKIASRVGRRLRLSRLDCDRLYTLVRYHMFHYQPQDTDASIRRLMRQVGLENLDDLLALREGDRLGSGARQTSWRLEELKKRMIEQLHQPFAVKDLAIDGHDLMKTFSLQPGPILGQTLNYLLEQVLDDASLNNREQLLALAQDFIVTSNSTREEKHVQ